VFPGKPFHLVYTFALHILKSSHTNCRDKYISLVIKGQKIRYRTLDIADMKYQGSVLQTGKATDDDDYSVMVYGSINNNDKQSFIEGMYIEAEIITSDRVSFGLPNEAVHNDGDKTYILVKQQETDDNIIFDKLYIETGQQYQNNIEIITDTLIRDVLIDGAFFITE